MKRFLYILISTVIVGAVLYFGLVYQMKLRNEMAVTFNAEPLFIFSTIFPIVVGLLFRLPKLILEIKDKKRWCFDWMKMIVIGVPSLYIAMVPILSFYFSPSVIIPLIDMFLGHASFTSIAGIVFGYALLDSLKNEHSSNSTH